MNATCNNMKTKLNFFFALLLVVGFWLLSGSQAQAACPRDTLKFKELCFLPSLGQTQWVVITNTGGESVEATGVELVSNGGYYSLPSGLESIPPGGIVVLVFDGAGAETNDYSFAGDNKAVLHSESGLPSATNFLGSPVGFCSLYRVTGAHSKDTIIDFVAWGGEPGAAAADAVENRDWVAKTVHLWTDPANPPVGPGGWNVMAGDSIGRDESGTWTHLPRIAAVFSLKGSVSLLNVPQPIFPNAGVEVLGSPARCTFSEVLAATEYEIQIATNSDFKNIVRTLITGDAKVGAPIAPHLPIDLVYWWRVRCNDAKGNTSSWSSVQQFTVGHPPTSQPTGPKPARGATKGASTYTVSGSIVDVRTSRGLQDCTVQIGGQTNVTDGWGRYAIAGLSPGTYPINVSRAHYPFATPGGRTARGPR